MKGMLPCALAAALALAPAVAPAQAGSRQPVAHTDAGTDTVEDQEMTDNAELMRLWLENFPEGEWEAFPGEVSPDFTLRLPFVPPGVPNAISGRENVRELLRETAKSRSRLVLSDIRILRTEDPELMVATARGEATMANGKPYRNAYVIFTRIRDGVVLEHTEYLNPLAFMEAAGE